MRVCFIGDSDWPLNLNETSVGKYLKGEVEDNRYEDVVFLGAMNTIPPQTSLQVSEQCVGRFQIAAVCCLITDLVRCCGE